MNDKGYKTMKNKNKSPRYMCSSTEECRKLLNLGFMLENIHGFTVFTLAGSTKQYKNNPRRKKNYSFSNPGFWGVKIDGSYVNLDSWAFKWEMFLQKMERIFL